VNYENGGWRIATYANDNRVLAPFPQAGAAPSSQIVLSQDTHSSEQRWHVKRP
jgi:hypothetical protein